MTAYTGTVNTFAAAGDKGQVGIGLLTYALTGALVNGDTITWTNALSGPKQAKVIGMLYSSPELDTSASPTATATIGDGTDADGYNTTFNLGLPVQAPANGAQIQNSGDGAIIGTSTHVGTNVVFTVTAAVATGATSGTIKIQPIVLGI